MAGSPDTFLGETVHGGGKNIGVAGATHIHTAHLIGENEENIGARRHTVGFCLKRRAKRNRIVD